MFLFQPNENDFDRLCKFLKIHRGREKNRDHHEKCRHQVLTRLKIYKTIYKLEKSMTNNHVLDQVLQALFDDSM